MQVMIEIYNDIHSISIWGTIKQKLKSHLHSCHRVGAPQILILRFLQLLLLLKLTCGQTGPNVSANFVPCHGTSFFGLSKRNASMGGWAYGTALNTCKVII